MFTVYLKALAAALKTKESSGTSLKSFKMADISQGLEMYAWASMLFAKERDLAAWLRLSET